MMKELIKAELEEYPLNADDIATWGAGTFSDHTTHYLIDILNGTYSIDAAVEDILSFRKTFKERKEKAGL